MLSFTISCYTVTQEGDPVFLIGTSQGISKEDAISIFVEDLDIDVDNADIEIEGPIWYTEEDGVKFPDAILN